MDRPKVFSFGTVQCLANIGASKSLFQIFSRLSLSLFPFSFFQSWPKFGDLINDNIELWHYGLWIFKTGDTKLQRFLPKNQHIQRELLKFHFLISFEPSKKMPKFDFRSQFSMSKSSKTFSIFFSFKKPNLGAHFFVIVIFGFG